MNWLILFEISSLGNDYIKSPFYFCKIRLSMVLDLFVEIMPFFSNGIFCGTLICKSGKNKKWERAEMGTLVGRH